MKELFLSVPWRGYQVSTGIQSIAVRNSVMRKKVWIITFLWNQGRTGRLSLCFLISICKWSHRNSNDMLLGVGGTLHCSEKLYLLFCSCTGWKSLCLWEVGACSRAEPSVGFYKMKLRRRLLYSKEQCVVTESALCAAYSTLPHQGRKARHAFLTKRMGTSRTLGAFNLAS